jgi:hypothetical protein
MSIPLAEALQQVDLEVGRTYRCRVKGHWVEVRVLLDRQSAEAPTVPESDIMLDPWVELPGPTGGKRVACKPGKLPPPDRPIIPDDEELP